MTYLEKMSLKALRVNAKLTQQELAEALGFALSTIKNWENGKTFPKQPAIEKLCEFYNVPYDYIRFE